MNEVKKPTATRCPILYDKSGILIVHKPAGILSHPNTQGKGKHERCAFEGPYSFNARRFDGPEGPVWLIHRLDQDTSGILVAARDPQAAKHLRYSFEHQQIRKVYAALVAGFVKPPEGWWDDHIDTRKHGGRLRSLIYAKRRPNATARYWLQSYLPKHRLSLLRIELQTGKTHQIRLQAAAREYPIAGDELYGDFALNKVLRKSLGLKRIFLHATELDINDPVRHKRLHVEDPLPEDLSEVFERASM